MSTPDRPTRALTVRPPGDSPARAETTATLTSLRGAIRPVDPGWIERGRTRHAQLTKPAGSLGVLEAVGAQLAAIQRSLAPSLGRGGVVVCAADHGVAAEGVSAFPAEVTAQMVAGFLAGGAAINQIARAADADVYVLDVGVRAAVAATAAGDGERRLVSRRVRAGSGNIAREPAMTLGEVESALAAGVAAAGEALAGGATVLAAGDMGIGNTTAAAALTAALLSIPAEAVTGRGTGVDDDAYRRKIDVVERALTRARARLGDLERADPLSVLAELGGLEIAAAGGVLLAGAAAGVPVVTDGFPVTAGALAAVRLVPELRGYLFAGHRSLEPGHAVQLRALGLTPLLELQMRLGEGTGATLAFGVLRAAAAVLAGMATFAEAGVAGPV